MSNKFKGLIVLLVLPILVVTILEMVTYSKIWCNKKENGIVIEVNHDVFIENVRAVFKAFEIDIFSNKKETDIFYEISLIDLNNNPFQSGTIIYHSQTNEIEILKIVSKDELMLDRVTLEEFREGNYTIKDLNKEKEYD